MNSIDRIINDLKSSETTIGGCTTVNEIVIALNSLKEREKQGEWVWEEDWTPSSPAGPAECNYAGWVCSECGGFPDEKQKYAEWDDPDEKPTYKHCPNCGIEMK